jgi:hypothetical protein
LAARRVPTPRHAAWVWARRGRPRVVHQLHVGSTRRGVAEHQIRSFGAAQDIPSCPAIKYIRQAISQTDDHIQIGASIRDVCSISRKQRVASGLTEQSVDPVLPLNLIGACATVAVINPCTTKHQIITVFPAQLIVVDSAIEHIASGATIKTIITGISGDLIIPTVAVGVVIS